MKVRVGDVRMILFCFSLLFFLTCIYLLSRTEFAAIDQKKWSTVADYRTSSLRVGWLEEDVRLSHREGMWSSLDKPQDLPHQGSLYVGAESYAHLLIAQAISADIREASYFSWNHGGGQFSFYPLYGSFDFFIPAEEALAIQLYGDEIILRSFREDSRIRVISNSKGSELALVEGAARFERGGRSHRLSLGQSLLASNDGSLRRVDSVTVSGSAGFRWMMSDLFAGHRLRHPIGSPVLLEWAGNSYDDQLYLEIARIGGISLKTVLLRAFQGRRSFVWLPDEPGRYLVRLGRGSVNRDKESPPDWLELDLWVGDEQRVGQNLVNSPDAERAERLARDVEAHRARAILPWTR